MKIPLQKLRKEAGFRSAKAFAESLGVPAATYTDWEQGRRLPALDMLWQIADALGDAMGRHVSLDELAGRDWPRIETSLSPAERTLLDAYRTANAQGRAAIDAVAGASSGVGQERPPGERAGGVSA